MELYFRIFASICVCVYTCVHLYVQIHTYTLNKIMLQKMLDPVFRFPDCIHCDTVRDMSGLESNSLLLYASVSLFAK